jgi:hypothetical protein
LGFLEIIILLDSRKPAPISKYNLKLPFHTPGYSAERTNYRTVWESFSRLQKNQ